MSLTRILTACMLILLAVVANAAPTYPINNPTYIPTAVLPTANLTTTGDVYFDVNGTNAVSVQLSGTHGSVVAAVQGSNQPMSVANASATWTTLSAVPVAGGAAVTSLTANGIWLVNGAGLTRVRLHVTTMASGTLTVNMAGTMMPGGLTILNPNTTSNPTAVTDQTGVNYVAVDASGIVSTKVTNGTQSMPTMDAVARPGFQKVTDGTSVAGVTAASTAPVAATPALVVAQSPNVLDPCASPAVAKSSAVINQGASATTKVVDVDGAKNIHVCGFVATAAGTSPTFTWKSGTNASADCDTGTVTLSGAMVPSATIGSVSYGGGSTLFASGASKQLCLTTGATTSVQGIITYVQQ